MSYINWDDVVKKLLPTHLRYEWHMDWLKSCFKGVKIIHSESLLLTNELDVKSDFNSAVALLRHRMNDIFDPYHRGISFTQQNFNVANDRGFIVNVPTYLQYGDIEDRITAVLQYYIHFGQIFTYNYVAAASTAAKTYIDAFGGTPSNSEIWAIINLYNKIRGHGFYSNIKRLHLMSPTAIADAKKDFINPATLLAEAGSGSIDYDRFGFASDGARYLTTGFVVNTEISDMQNYSWGIYISKEVSESSPKIESGVIDAGKYSRFGINVVSEDIAQFANGNSTDVMQFSNPDDSKTGMYSMVATSGTAIAYKSHELKATKVMAAASRPTIGKFLCCENNGGTPQNFSKSKIGTYYEIDAALTITQRHAIDSAIVEYNNLISR